VIVIGAGHAGIEAAHAAATLGAKTAVFTMSLDAIGNMPCNPSMAELQKDAGTRIGLRWAVRWALRRMPPYWLEPDAEQGKALPLIALAALTTRR